MLFLYYQQLKKYNYLLEIWQNYFLKGKKMVLSFFQIGPGELLFIALIALLLFGRRLPEVMHSIGKGITEFKKGLHASDDEEDDRDKFALKEGSSAEKHEKDEEEESSPPADSPAG